jgi:DNA repair protein RadC
MTDTPPSPIFRVRELTVTYRGERLPSPFTGSLLQPEDAANLAAVMLRDSATEVALIFHLNVRQRLIGTHRIVGNLDRVDVSIGDVCRAALLSNARSLIFVHNHLGGNPAASEQDRHFVQRLQTTMRLLDLTLLDALIVIDPTEGQSYYSFSEHGLL